MKIIVIESMKRVQQVQIQIEKVTH